MPAARVAEQPELLLFSRTAFAPKLHAADHRAEVELINLHRLYNGS